MWEYVQDLFCPHCAAKALWGVTNEQGVRVMYCVACNSRLVLGVTVHEHLSPAEREELQEVRKTANVGSNSAVGAFGPTT